MNSDLIKVNLSSSSPIPNETYKFNKSSGSCINWLFVIMLFYKQSI